MTALTESRAQGPLGGPGVPKRGPMGPQRGPRGRKAKTKKKEEREEKRKEKRKEKKKKQGPAGQRWVLGYFKHIQQCQICPFLTFEKKQVTDGPSDRRTDGRTHPHIEMGGPI